MAEIRNWKGIKVFPEHNFAMLIPLKNGSRSIMHALRMSRIRWAGWNLGELEKHPEYYKIGFARNPWDRAVSFWANCVNKRRIRRVFTDLGFEPHMRFTEALEIIENNPFGNPHFMPQTALLFGGENIVPDKIVKFEELEKGWEEIRVQFPELGLPGLKHLNRSRHEPFGQYYTPATAETVKRIYAMDVARLGYSNQGPFFLEE